jgi:nucleoside-diphosphate-sugar epimerase
VVVRVVVVGASGNVGTSVVEALAAEPEVTDVVGLARRRPAWEAPKTTWVEADVAADALVPHFRGAGAVIHLAWLFQPTHRPDVTWRANAVGSARLFQAVAEAHVPVLIYASSVGAYSPGPKDEPGVDETWPTHGFPLAAYSREKAYVERLLDTLEAQHPGIRVVRMRPGFIFKRESASEQRRLFAGPLLPGRLLRPGLIPVLPDVPNLRFQALHTADAAQAYRLALTLPVSGAFNLAAEPVVDGSRLAELLGARLQRVPAGALRVSLAAAWHLHLTPASPHLFELALALPVLNTRRAREELGWVPAHTSLDALSEFLQGLREGAGMETPPLDPRSGGPLRVREVLTATGERDKSG